MGRRLARAVAVFGPDGAPHTFRPGDEAPDWLEEKVTNPAIWGEHVPEDEPRGVPTSEVESEPEHGATEHENRAAGATVDEYDPESGPPPKGGAGSGRGAWAAYAEANDLGVTESMSRDDIIELCDQMEVPTE